jgi:hypothetical protein
MSEVSKQSNILDPVQDTLDQDVFNGTTPKESFFEYHLDHIKEVFRQNGFNPYAFDFYLTGSLCTYQYSKTSDVDISIVCNVNEFSESDRSDLIAIVVNSLDGEFFPRTQHQYQHFVQPIGINIQDLFTLGLRGAWDFQKNGWVVKPKKKYAHDVSSEKPSWILEGVQMSDKINVLLDNNQDEEAKELYRLIHERRAEDQKKYGDYSEGNIIYKFLDNNGTFDRLRNAGQRIASTKESFVLDYELTDDELDLFYGDAQLPVTHLNAFGNPCSCAFGKKDQKAVKRYYENLSAPQKQQKTADAIKVNENPEFSKVEKKFKEIVEKEFDPSNRWVRRYPEQAEWIKTKLLDPKDRKRSNFYSVRDFIDENSIKFLRGAITLLKKEIREKDPTNNQSRQRELFGITGAPAERLRKENPFEENFRGLYGIPESKILDQFKELYRQLWTNNYGKGFKSYFGIRDNFGINQTMLSDPSRIDEELIGTINFLSEKKETFRQGLPKVLLDNLTGLLFDKWNLKYSKNPQSRKDHVLPSIEDKFFPYSRHGDPEAVIQSESNQNRDQIIDFIANELESKDHITPPILSLLLYRGYYSVNNASSLEFYENLDKFLSSEDYNKSPEKQINFLIAADPYYKHIYEDFGSVLRQFGDKETFDSAVGGDGDPIAKIIDRYRINFPTNINEFGNFANVALRLREIVAETQEQEEYRVLRENFDKSNWENEDPAFTFDVKKGDAKKGISSGTWGVYRVDSLSDLELEGALMKHCIGQEDTDHYQRRAMEMNTVYSVRDPQGIPFATLELTDDARYIGEAYGRKDHALRPNEKKILNAFFAQPQFSDNGTRPGTWLLRTVGGNEIRVTADNQDQAIEQYLNSLNSPNQINPDTKEILNTEDKIASIYSAGHHWFSKKEEDRTGSSWGGYLPDPYYEDEEEEREPYTEEVSFEEQNSVDSMPSTNYMSFDEAYELFFWALDLEDKSNWTITDTEVFNGYLSDDEVQMDEEGHPFYWEVVGLDNYSSMNLVFELIEQAIDKVDAEFSNDEDSENNEVGLEDIFEEDVDFFNNLKGIATAYLLALIDVNAHGSWRTGSSLRQTVLNYIKNKTLKAKDSKKHYEVLSALLYFFKDATWSHLRNTDESQVTNLGKPGSYSFYNNFGEINSATNNSEIEAEKPSQRTHRNDYTAANYQYMIDNLEVGNDLYNNYYNLPPHGQTDMSTMESDPTYQVYPSFDEESGENYSQYYANEERLQKGYEINRIVDNYWGSSYNHGEQGEIRRNKELLRSYYEMKRNEKMQQEKPDNMPGQLNLFDMPPEPSDEEATLYWERRQRSRSLTPNVGFTPNSSVYSDNEARQ